MKRIAIVGGGLAGLTAASEVARLAQAGHPLEATLFEASARLGGILETAHEQGFTIELGPDAWLTEKPQATELAIELGLEAELLPSNDATRRTWILHHGRLQPIPDGMRLMVPTNLDAIETSSLFSPAARQAYRDEILRADELRRLAPDHDESIATFTRRHFGQEVLETIATPLLSGILGGNPEHLSVRSVMAPFVAMERRHGSLILALQSSVRRSPLPLFTTLSTGLGTLIDRLTATLPPASIHLHTPITAIARTPTGWSVTSNQPVSTSTQTATFDALILATPAATTRHLLHPTDPTAASLLEIPSSSAIVVALGFTEPFDLPQGFGLLVPPHSGTPLLACTFVDQKFPGRTPAPSPASPTPRLLRAFFGGPTVTPLLDQTDSELIALAQQELSKILGPLPQPSVQIVRRWPSSLPQYAVGHLDRMEHLDARIAQAGNLALLGNAYRGVGIPDLIREGRRAIAALLLPRPT